MIDKLSRRLFLSFFFTIGGMLFLVFSGLFLIQRRQIIERDTASFSLEFTDLVTKFTESQVVDLRRLDSEERERGALIHLESDGRPLLTLNSVFSGRERSFLAGRVKQLAESEGGNSAPGSPALGNSAPVYFFRDSSGSRFCGSMYTFTTSGTVNTLVYVKRLDRQSREIAVQGLFLLAGGLVSLSVLAVISRLLTARAVAPVRENAEKQAQFVAAASHELRSPLAVIEANSDLIELKAPDMLPYTAQIESESKRMAGLVRDLLTLSSSGPEISLAGEEEIETDTFVIHLYEAYFPVCERLCHPLSIDLPEEALPPVRGDIDRLSQLFAILLDNALSHTPQGTEICLSARPLRRRGLLLAVVDHGPGVHPESREKIFDRFYRSDPSRSDKSHYGLGLSIARELALAHGAKLYVRDTPGGGATFCVEFPG